MISDQYDWLLRNEMLGWRAASKTIYISCLSDRNKSKRWGLGMTAFLILSPLLFLSRGMGKILEFLEL